MTLSQLLNGRRTLVLSSLFLGWCCSQSQALTLLCTMVLEGAVFPVGSVRFGLRKSSVQFGFFSVRFLYDMYIAFSCVVHMPNLCTTYVTGKMSNKAVYDVRENVSHFANCLVITDVE